MFYDLYQCVTVGLHVCMCVCAVLCFQMPLATVQSFWKQTQSKIGNDFTTQ